MRTLSLTSRIGPDGRLRVDVPVGLANIELEVLIVLNPLSHATGESPARRPWPAGFLDTNFGSLRDVAIERPEQGTLEQRDSLE